MSNPDSFPTAPRRAVFEYVIPIINYFAPFRTMVATLVIDAADPFDVPPKPLLFRAWWGSWLALNIVGTIMVYGPRFYDLKLSPEWSLAQTCLRVVASAFAVMVVRAVSAHVSRARPHA